MGRQGSVGIWNEGWKIRMGHSVLVRLPRGGF